MKPARILVVDDDDHVRDALVDELSPHYSVEAVSSGTLREPGWIQGISATKTTRVVVQLFHTSCCA